LDKPWIFALVHLLDRMVTVQRLSNKTLGTDERLGLFFDEKDEFAGRVGEMVRAIKRNLMDYPLGDVAFDDSRNQPALQAADLLAYEARRSMTEVVLPTDPSKEVRDQWWQLMHATLPSGGRRIWADYWDAEALLRNVNDVSLDEDDGPQSIPAETADTAVRWLTGRGSGSP
jgi:hypothetical protein